VRDSEEQIMKKVCRDVQIEPTLLAINEIDFERKVNIADNARLVFLREDCGIAVRKHSLT